MFGLKSAEEYPSPEWVVWGAFVFGFFIGFVLGVVSF